MRKNLAATQRIRRKRWRSALALIGVAACDALLTEAPDDADLFDAPLPGLTRTEQAAFVRGDEEFGRAFTVASGLGPIFNDVSCAACHSGDGRGAPEDVLTRFSDDGDPHGGPGGPQLQDRAIPGAVAEILPPGMQVSRRLPPPVFGAGLIEAIPESALAALEDPDDADGDGISGRVHWVTPADFVPAAEPGGGGAPRVGRFGRKAQVSSILEQTVTAYLQDIGVTSDFAPAENVNPQAPGSVESADRVVDPEIPASTVMAVVSYLRMLAPPAPGEETESRAQGRMVFHSIGCASCHVPQLRTGPSPVAALANRTVTLYSDLLLHDMGDELADHRPDGDASGREWRTTPLWGLRLMRDFLNGEAFLLHDGRARSIESAIELHGGEAATVRDRFRALSAQDRVALLDFVGSR